MLLFFSRLRVFLRFQVCQRQILLRWGQTQGDRSAIFILCTLSIQCFKFLIGPENLIAVLSFQGGGGGDCFCLYGLICMFPYREKNVRILTAASQNEANHQIVHKITKTIRHFQHLSSIHRNHVLNFKELRSFTGSSNFVEIDVTMTLFPAMSNIMKYTLFYKKLMSGLSTQSFLAFCDFEYSKFLNSLLTFFSKIEQQAKENTVL